jgi:hypothetical protein
MPDARTIQRTVRKRISELEGLIEALIAEADRLRHVASRFQSAGDSDLARRRPRLEHAGTRMGSS